MEQNQTQKKFLAIITCGISVFIGIIYLVLITILDSRGPILPPPSEAFDELGVVFVDFFLRAQSLFLVLYQ